MLNGKLLYLDVWSHKQPVVYLLNALAIWLGGPDVRSVVLLQRILLVVSVITLYSILVIALRSRLTALIGALFFLILFTQPSLLENGNLTEQYAVTFSLLGVWLAVNSVCFPAPVLVLSSASGLAFSIATFTKVPFVLSSLPWFVYLITGPVGCSGRDRTRAAFYFVLGAMVPLILLIGYLSFNGAFEPWIDGFSYNFAYLESIRPVNGALDRVLRVPSRLFEKVLLLFVSGTFLICCSFPTIFRRGCEGQGRFAAAVLGMLALDSIGAAASPADFGHYHLQVVPACAMAVAVGLRFITTTKGGIPRTLIFFLGLCLLKDASALYDFHRRFLPGPVTRPDPIVDFVREHAGREDRLWVTDGRFDRYYLYTQLLSPTRYLDFFDHVFLDTRRSSAAEKLGGLRRDLVKAPPRFLLHDPKSPHRTLIEIGLVDWIHENYEPVPIARTSTRLFTLREKPIDKMADEMVTAQTDESERPQRRRLDSLGMELVRIPAGRISIRNRPSGRETSPMAQPLEISIGPGMWMGTRPITRGQFAKIMGRTEPVEPERTVSSIPWHQADEFCGRLTSLTRANGEIPLDHSFRLPSEAEWEYVCRLETEPGRPALAVEKLGGEVWQWCQDTWHEDRTGLPTDATAWVTPGKELLRVIRGGSHLRSAEIDTCALRSFVKDSNSFLGRVGFRVVMAKEDDRNNHLPSVSAGSIFTR
jgi:formylglycine-generating enzyme required for sulfatase activity